MTQVLMKHKNKFINLGVIAQFLELDHLDLNCDSSLSSIVTLFQLLNLSVTHKQAVQLCYSS